MKKILGVILGVGFVFRLLLLGKRQLWTDELLQALVVRSDTLGALLNKLRDGIVLPVPLDFIIQKGFVSILGESAWSLRLHAVVLGTLSLWIFYRIARLLFGDRVALYSTTLFTFLPLHYHYSQEGEPYALLTFLALLSFELLLRLVIKRSAGGWAWLSLAATLLLLLYSSVIGFAVLAAQLSCLLVAASNVRSPDAGIHEGRAIADLPTIGWKVVLLYGLCALAAIALFLPWAFMFWTKPVTSALPDLVHPKILVRLIRELGDNSYAVACLLLIGVGTGTSALMRHGCGRHLRWMTCWFLVTLPAIFLIDLCAGSSFRIAQILPAVPALALLAGYGLSYMGERMTILDELPIQVSFPALVYAGALILTSAFIARSHWGRELVDYTGTVRYLNESLRPGDLLVVPKAYSLLEYYSPALSELRVGVPDPGPDQWAASQTKGSVIVCHDAIKPDPCAGFRSRAINDSAWNRREFRGLTVFRHPK